MEVRLTRCAAKQLMRLGPVRQTILAKIDQYAADPTSLANNVKTLKDREEFRLRVGDYRVLFTVSEDGTVTIMTIIAIAHRREVYG